MRLTFAATMRDSYEGIETAAERMIKFQRQVSTGIRVAQPSDDPSATATVISEKAAKASYEQYTQAGDSAESRLAVADTLLSDIIDKLAAARTSILSVQGSETTHAQRENGAQELASLRDAILEDLTTSFRGTYMFGGAAGTVRPYSKDVNGVVQAVRGLDARDVTVDIDRNRPVTVVFDGSAIAQGSDPPICSPPSKTRSPPPGPAMPPRCTTASHDLQRAFDRASQVQSSVGTSLRAIADHTATLEEAGRASQGARGVARGSQHGRGHLRPAAVGDRLQRRARRRGAHHAPLAVRLPRVITDAKRRCSRVSLTRTVRRPTSGRGSRATRSRFPTAFPGSRPAGGSCCCASEAIAPLQRLESIEGTARGVPRHRPAAGAGGLPLPPERQRPARARRRRRRRRCCGSPSSPRRPTARSSANLRAPIVINPQRMIGRQVLPDDGLYPIRHVLTPRA